MLDSIYKSQKEEVKSETTSGIFYQGKKKIYLIIKVFGSEILSRNRN